MRIKYKRILIILVYIVFWGNLFKLESIQLLGVTINLYRIAIPILVLMSMIGKTKDELFVKKKISIFWDYLVLAWVVWGIVSMNISVYSNLHDGIKEIISLLYMFFITVIICNCVDKDNLSQFFYTIRVNYFLILMIAVMEMLTGIHLPTSCFVENITLSDTSAILLNHRNVHMATGLFYNPNDLAACLALFTPILYVNISKLSVIKKIARIILLIMTIVIMFVNDANIAIYTVLIAFSIYLGIHFSIKEKIELVMMGLILFFPVEKMAFVKLVDVFIEQYKNMSKGIGSFASRMMIYEDSIKLVKNTRGIGTGTASFTNYFRLNPSESGLVNPHNFWLEIMTQYGVVIAGLFIVFFVVLLKKNKKCYLKVKNEYALMNYLLLWSLIFASIISSSYLKVTYLGLVLGSAILIPDIIQEERN